MYSKATQDQVASLKVIEYGEYKYNTQLRDVIQRVRLIANTTLSINLSEFSDQNHTNILETGNTSLILQYIDHDSNGAVRPVRTQIQALIDCLAQVWAIGGRGAAQLERDFKAKLYALAHAHHGEVINFTNAHNFLKDDPKLKNIIRLMENLAKQQIDLSLFSDGTIPEVDISQTGEIDLVIAYIDTHLHPHQIRIEMLLACLSQVITLKGPFQGLCESQLRHKIYQLAELYPKDTERAMQSIKLNHDPNLLKTFQALRVLLARPFEINITEFFTDSGFINILETGQIDLLFDYIDLPRLALSTPAQINIVISCLSQTLHGTGRYQGKCERELKIKVSNLAKHQPQEVYNAYKDKKN